MDILTRGRKRFEILSLDEELDYLRAEVHYFDDEDQAQPEPEIRKQVLRHFRLLKKLDGSQDRGEPDLADPQLSFQLAQSLPDLDFLSTLLRQRSEASRRKQLNQYLADYIPRQRAIERVHRTVAVGNLVVNFFTHAHPNGRLADGFLHVAAHRDVIRLHVERFIALFERLADEQRERCLGGRDAVRPTCPFRRKDICRHR